MALPSLLVHSEWALALAFQLQVCTMIGRIAGPLASTSASFSAGLRWANYDFFPWINFFPVSPGASLESGSCQDSMINVLLLRLCELSSCLMFTFVAREATRRVYVSRIKDLSCAVPRAISFPSWEVPTLLTQLYPLTDVLAATIATGCEKWVILACILLLATVVAVLLGFGKAVMQRRRTFILTKGREEGTGDKGHHHHQQPAGILEWQYKDTAWAFFMVEASRKMLMAVVLSLTSGEARAVLSCVLFGGYLALVCFFRPMKLDALACQAALIASTDTVAVVFAASPVFGWTDQDLAAPFAIIFAFAGLIAACLGVLCASLISLTPMGKRLVDLVEKDAEVLVLVEGPVGTPSQIPPNYIEVDGPSGKQPEASPLREKTTAGAVSRVSVRE